MLSKASHRETKRSLRMFWIRFLNGLPETKSEYQLVECISSWMHSLRKERCRASEEPTDDFHDGIGRITTEIKRHDWIQLSPVNQTLHQYSSDHYFSTTGSENRTCGLKQTKLTWRRTNSHSSGLAYWFPMIEGGVFQYQQTFLILFQRFFQAEESYTEDELGTETI